MSSVVGRSAAVKREHRQRSVAIKKALRDLNNQLAFLNHRVGAHLELKDVDLSCLDLIQREGPLSPTDVARRTGLHPATMTGILDRLERGGWITRERHAVDRRAIVVRASRDRLGEIYAALAGMNTAMDGILDEYDPAELELLTDFLARTARAGRHATDDLAEPA